MNESFFPQVLQYDFTCNRFHRLIYTTIVKIEKLIQTE